MSKLPQPVAWAMRRPDGLVLDVITPEEHESHEGEYTVPLYAAQPAPVPLTDEQIIGMLLELNTRRTVANGPREMFTIIVRAVEAHHGIGAAP